MSIPSSHDLICRQNAVFYADIYMWLNIDFLIGKKTKLNRNDCEKKKTKTVCQNMHYNFGNLPLKHFLFSIIYLFIYISFE